MLPHSLVLCLLVLTPAAGSPRSVHVDCLPGNGLPVILSAPHGGSSTPSNIRNRDYGCWVDGACVWTHTCGVKDKARCRATTVRDTNTQEQARELRAAMCTHFGVCPALVVNLLRRSKFDANREVHQATFNVSEVVTAFDAYHACIDNAKAAISGTGGHGSGLFLDIHGHGHPNIRAELGYLIRGENLNLDNFVAADTSIKNLASSVSIQFEELLRGNLSFGGMLEAEGFVAVPSPKYPGPAGEKYYSGGYNTRTHGSRDAGMVDAIQIESPFAYRDTQRPAYVTALTKMVDSYLRQHYGYTDTRQGTTPAESVHSISMISEIIFTSEGRDEMAGTSSILEGRESGEGHKEVSSGYRPTDREVNAGQCLLYSNSNVYRYFPLYVIVFILFYKT